MEERHIRVQRTARYHTLGDPRTARSLWIVVHGYGQLARFFLNAFEEQADTNFITAPEGLSRYYTDATHQRVGATWMTREDRENEIQDHVDYLDALYASLRLETGDIPLRVFGFSQGVATVSRWLVHRGPNAVQAVLWGGSLPPELTVEQLKRGFHSRTVDLVHGALDQLVPEATFRSNSERLQRAGVVVRPHLFPGGHNLDPVIMDRCFGPPL
ncbi:MAG: hypothetical protein JNM62_13265 [Flavobacteriales bacterium]|nr:hypothetical protein [Flavobacteriales bacterium]